MGAAVLQRSAIEIASEAAWSHEGETLGGCARASQAAWAARPIAERLTILRGARHRMAERAEGFGTAIPAELQRSTADTLVAELLPLLDACRFLERRAAAILRTRRLGRRGLPWWLNGLASEVERVPFGQILIFGPSNYPLLLPGVQTMQALAAGNAVVWKPGRGGGAVARIVAEALYDAGLPQELLCVAGESTEAGRDALHGAVNGVRPDKVIFTGSVQSGRSVMHALADSLTPCVAELSGCDAVIALTSASDSAAMDRLVAALCFGMRLNGSATCMAPRRLFLLGWPAERRDMLRSRLRDAFAAVPPVAIADEPAARLQALLRDARRKGAAVLGDVETSEDGLLVAPVLITEATAQMDVAQADLFAPVLSVIAVADGAELLAAEAACPYALTVSLFGNAQEARVLARTLTAGTVLVNDLIVPTADPRVPFGGRRGSGFGTTRGAEGLLEMTAPRAVVVRTGTDTRRYQPTGEGHTAFFQGIIRLSHGATWRERWAGLRQFLAAARTLR